MVQGQQATVLPVQMAFNSVCCDAMQEPGEMAPPSFHVAVMHVSAPRFFSMPLLLGPLLVLPAGIKLQSCVLSALSQGSVW